MAQPFPNELKHRYNEVEFIGSGGFGRVFRAKRKDGRVVAVKIPLSPDEVTGKSFLWEFTSWQRLNHKNIVSLFDANVFPIPYLEQEYMDGGSLEDLKKPLEVTQACEIVFDIAEGLKYANKQGIVHRDLKPKNILLSKDKVPKITDWGMSRIIAESKSSTLGGYTPWYASPEQVSPKKFGKPDERTDIYQLGVIFYNLLTNDLPFKGDDLAEIAIAIIMEEPVAPSKLNPEAKKVEYIVLRCLSKNQEERYQTAEELQAELDNFIKKKEPENEASETLKLYPENSKAIEGIDEWNKILDELINQRKFIESMTRSVTLTPLASPTGTSYNLSTGTPDDYNYGTNVVGLITRQYFVGEKETGEICRFGIHDFVDIIYYWSGAAKGDRDALKITLEFIDGTTFASEKLFIHEWSKLRPKGNKNPYVEYLISPNERVWFKYGIENPNPEKEIRYIIFEDVSAEGAVRIANVLHYVTRVKPLTIDTKKAKEEINKKRIIELSSNAQKLFENKMYAEAIAKWQDVLDLDSENSKAIEGIDECNKILDKINLLNNSAQRIYDKGMYKQAIDKWNEVLNLYPDNKIAKDGIKKAEDNEPMEVYDFCQNCGRKNEDILNYCIHCGANLSVT